MKPPWVSRAAHDALREMAFEAGERIAEGQREIRRLTDIIVELKRDGFNPPARPESYGPTEPDLPDVVTKEIEALAKSGDDLWRQLMRGARQELRPDHSNAEDVARRIRLGGEPEEDDGA